VQRLLKRRLEIAMGSRAVARLTRRRVLGKRLILAYHGITPDGEAPAGERELFVSQRDFALHLDMLGSEAEVVSLDRIDEPGDERPRVAITFDDAYRGAVNEGVRELAKRALPATIFVVPALLNDHVFWWDALADRSSTMLGEIRNHALHELGGADERIRAWAAQAAIPMSDALPSYARTATIAEISAALKFPGIRVGSHTWSHPNLASLASADIMREVRRSRAWLCGQFGEKTVNWLAYPYGLDSRDVQHAVADASYAGALRIGGGWHRAGDVSRFARPRFSVSAHLSVAGLRARLRGGLPA